MIFSTRNKAQLLRREKLMQEKEEREREKRREDQALRGKLARGRQLCQKAKPLGNVLYRHHNMNVSTRA